MKRNTPPTRQSLIDAALKRKGRFAPRASTTMCNGRYYWLDPLGNVYSCSYSEHDWWAERLIDDAGHEGMFVYDCAEFLQSRGWRRIGISQWDIDVWPSRFSKVQRAALKKWCAVDKRRTIMKYNRGC